MSEPKAGKSRPRSYRLLAILAVFACIAIPLSLYYNKTSARWVPDADAKVVAAKRQQAADAFAALKADAAQHPNAGPSQIRYAQALVERGRLVEAAIPAERAVKADPKNPAPRLILGDILAELGYRQEALGNYRAAIGLNPDFLPAYQHLGDLVAAADPAAAEKIYSDARDRQPGDAGPRLSLAQLYLQQAKNDKALEVLDPVLKTADPPVAALFIAGKAEVEMGRAVSGIELFRKAIAKQPDFADAYHSLGAALCNQGNPAEGVPALRRAIALQPGNPKFHYALANALFADTSLPNRLGEAQAEYEIALGQDPSSEWTHYYYGVDLEQEGELESAAREYRRVLEINPKFMSCYYRLGSIYRAQGRAAEAKQLLAYFDKMNKLAITQVHGGRRERSALDTAELHYRRGMDALHAGSRDLARSEFQAALERDPGHAAAKRELQGLGGARGHK